MAGKQKPHQAQRVLKQATGALEAKSKPTNFMSLIYFSRVVEVFRQVDDYFSSDPVVILPCGFGISLSAVFHPCPSPACIAPPSKEVPGWTCHFPCLRPRTRHLARGDASKWTKWTTLPIHSSHIAGENRTHRVANAIL